MPSVLADAVLSFRLLKVGGFLIFDDMLVFPDVGRAMEYFVEAFGGEHRLEVLHNEVGNWVETAACGVGSSVPRKVQTFEIECCEGTYRRPFFLPQ